MTIKSKHLVQKIYIFAGAVAVFLLVAGITLSALEGASVPGNGANIASRVFSIAAYIVLILALLCLFVYSCFHARRQFSVFKDDKSIRTVPFVSSLGAAVSLICLAAYLLSVGSGLVFSSVSSSFESEFVNVIPPFAYSSSKYGEPMVIHTVLSVCLIIVSVSFCAVCIIGVVSVSSRKYTAFAVSFLSYYSSSLIIFIMFILWDFPKASLYSGYLVSGTYAGLMAGYASAALSLFISDIIFYLCCSKYISSRKTMKEKVSHSGNRPLTDKKKSRK